VKSAVVRDLFNLVGVPPLPVDLGAKQPARKGNNAAPEAIVAKAEAEAELARLAIGGNGFRPLPID
jgi:hypothetical protein